MLLMNPLSLPGTLQPLGQRDWVFSQTEGPSMTVSSNAYKGTHERLTIRGSNSLVVWIGLAVISLPGQVLFIAFNDCILSMVKLLLPFLKGFLMVSVETIRMDGR